MKNNKGSILNIVLVLFLVVTLFISNGVFLLRKQINNFDSVQEIMKQKNLEIMLVEYYRKELLKNTLANNIYEIDDGQVEYKVEYINDCYNIETTVTMKKNTYHFTVSIDYPSYRLSDISY